MKHTRFHRISGILIPLTLGALSVTIIVSISTTAYLLRAEISPVTEGETASGSDVMVASPHPSAMPEREERAEGFMVRILNEQKNQASYHHWMDGHRTKTLLHLSDCRREVRYANRDTKFPTIQRCFRGQLTLNLEGLRKERSYLASRPGLSKSSRTELLSAVDELTEAITAIVDGIDTGVFVAEDNFQEAKRNLADLYRTPMWIAQVHGSADVLLTWAAHLIIQMKEHMQLAEDPERTQILRNTVDCFRDAEFLLKDTVALSEYEAAEEALTQSLIHMHTCLEIAEGAPYNTSTPQETEPVIPEPTPLPPEPEPASPEPSRRDPEPERFRNFVEELPYIPRPLQRQLDMSISPLIKAVRY